MLAKHKWNVYRVGTRHTIHQAFIQKSFNYSIVCGEPTEKVCACVREGQRESEREKTKAKVGFLNSAQAYANTTRHRKRVREPTGYIVCLCTGIRPETNASPDHKQKT